MISPSNSEDRRISKFIYRQQIIHLREKNIVYPTERSENAVAFSKLAGQDIRFSMKMVFAVGSGNLAAACLNWYDRPNILQEFKERFAVQEKKLVIFFHVVHFVLDFLTSGSAHPDRKDRSLAVPVIRRPA
jgi:hypothetical protein